MSYFTTMHPRTTASVGRLSAFVLPAALLTALLGMSAPARGALIPLSVEEMTHQSKHVVTGKVVRTRSYYEDVENLGTIIYTDVTIRLTSRILGAFEKKEMTLKVPGGVVGKVRQVWAEAAEFAEGELVLVFVREFKNQLLITGWKQGKYRLTPDAGTVLGKGNLPIGRNTPLSTVRTQVRLFNATRPPASATPGAASAVEDKR